MPIRVRIRHVTRGVEQTVQQRIAHILVLSGHWEYVPEARTEPAPQDPTPPPLEARPYNDLRREAAERGIVPEGRTKDDYLKALQGADESDSVEEPEEDEEVTPDPATYQRRDLQAE